MSKIQLINIRGINENDDIYYRYKMPKVMTITAKTKTVIININEISKSINRNPKIIINYIKNKLSTPINFNETENRAELKGNDDSLIQNAIFEMIEYLVLCPTCKNPETDLYLKKNNIIIKCKACSHDKPIKIVNNIVDKVCDQIIKNKYIE